MISAILAVFLWFIAGCTIITSTVVIAAIILFVAEEGKDMRESRDLGDD